MKVKVIERKDNKLMDREEISLVIEYDGATPTREQIRDRVVGEFGFSQDNFVIRENIPVAGSHELLVLVHHYKDKKRMEELEPEYILNRNKKKEEKKEEE